MLNTIYPNYVPQVPMYNNSMVMNPQVRPIQPIQAPVNIPTVMPVEPIQQIQIASPQAANAIQAYVSPIIQQYKAPTVEEYTNNLQKNGKIQGKDYLVEKDDQFCDVKEYKGGQESKCSVWKNIDGNYKYLGSEEYTYVNGRKFATDARNEKGDLEFHAHYYYNDQTKQEIISHDGLNIQTNIDAYKEKLKQNGVKYTEQTETNDFGGTSQIVEEYDETGKETMKTVWVTNPKEPMRKYIDRALYRADGTIGTSIYYDEEKTVVTNYVA